MLGSRPVNARRLPAILLLLYLIFLAYGSFFPFHFRHGSVTPISAEEMTALRAAYPVSTR